jgi:nitrate/TMAO reductase-like tetraheme cytochrome c subunit
MSPQPTILLVVLALLSAALVAVVAWRSDAPPTRGGKILAFLVLFLLPVFSFAMGVDNQIERSKSTQFCLSCHVMEPFGQSLKVDDPTYLAAAHYQNHRVPADEACYTCHTNYAMFGSFKAKLAGLRHVYIYYLTKPPAPEAIRIHEPFNNRECLHCHLGARSFEQGVVHTADPDTLPAIKANKLSCISSGCHETVHNVAHLKDLKMWNGPN